MSDLERLRAAGHDIINATDDPEFCWTHNRTGGECLTTLNEAEGANPQATTPEATS